MNQTRSDPSLVERSICFGWARLGKSVALSWYPFPRGRIMSVRPSVNAVGLVIRSLEIWKASSLKELTELVHRIDGTPPIGDSHIDLSPAVAIETGTLLLANMDAPISNVESRYGEGPLFWVALRIEVDPS